MIVQNTYKDVYQWFVQYQGESSWLAEFDESRPDGRGFGEINQEQVTAIALGVFDGQYHHFSHQVSLPQWATPVFFRRRSVIFNPNDESSQQGTLAHCIGWKRGGEAVYLFVRDDGSTLLSSDLQAI